MLYAIVAVIALIIDQGLKYWVTANITLNTGVREFLPGFVRLTNIHNSGAAFGIFSNSDIARWIFLGITAVFAIIVIVALAAKKIDKRFGRWMAVLVLAGALGNGIDRVIHDYVVDMFQFEFFSSFPVFNFADVLITVGGVLFCLYVIFHKPAVVSDEEKQAAEEKKARLAAAKNSVKGGADIREVDRISARGKVPERAEKPAQKQTRQAEPVSEPVSEIEPEPEKKAPSAADEDSYRKWEKSLTPEKIPVFTPPEQEAAPAQEKTHVTVDNEEMEFSLEDILNEFK